jgi:opacity protein-like surface antigen
MTMKTFITTCFLTIMVTAASAESNCVAVSESNYYHQNAVEITEVNATSETTDELINQIDSAESRNNGLKPGYKFMFNMGPQRGIGNLYKADRLQFDVINGYQINPYFSLGLGIGARYYSAQQALLVPIFLDIRTNFTNKPLSPYVAVGAGYSLVASNDFKDVGLLLNPSAGVSIRISDKSAMNVGLGYEVQNLRNVQLNVYHRWSKTVQASAITLNVGLAF